MKNVWGYPYKKSLDEFCEEIKQKLDDQEIYHFKYPEDAIASNNWNDELIKNIKDLNEEFLASLIHKANIYVLYEKNETNQQWIARYVGQRHSKEIRTRLSDHLINKSKDTKSKILKVKEVILNNGYIGVKVIKIEPEELRIYVESYLIKKLDSPEWNAHGRV